MADNSFIAKRLSQAGELIIGAGLLIVIAMLVLPLAPFMLDFLLVFNIGLSLIVLLLTLYIKKSINFSIFPSLLLIITLFRLGLNVACSRGILTKSTAASSIINAFGGFIVGGNYVVGLVIFIILVIIQFVVITNGAQRVAEVSARFTLDAMPGKQMAIDADLNAGIITEEQARTRREDIESEADFYGAMDGAARFIRGDAIAAIIIVIINIVGGFVVGVLQHNLSIQEALKTYILLTIGAGIAVQIPALLVSTGAGMIVSRVSLEGDFGKDMSSQIFSQPQALVVAAILLFTFLFIPTLPKIPFMVIAFATGGIAYILKNASKKAQQEELQQQEKEAVLKRKPENVMNLLKVDPAELEIGYGLIPLVNPEQGGTLLDRVTLIRRQLALDLGFVVPPVRIRDNVQLGPNEYVIKVKGIEVAKKSVQLNHYLAINPGKVKEEIRGVAGTEPVFNLPGVWIMESQRRRAELNGYTVVDIPTVISTHLSEVIKKHAPQLLTRQDTQNLIDNLKKDYPALVDELVPNIMNVGDIQKVLKGLLSERVPIRDLVTICETLADAVRFTKNIDSLTESVRTALGSHICKQYVAKDKVLYVATISPELEHLLIEKITSQPEGNQISWEPGFIKKFLQSVTKGVEEILKRGYQPVVLVAPQLRLPFRRLTERSFPSLAVISYREIPPEQEVKVLGRIENFNEESYTSPTAVGEES
ncbi:MAG: flagellar biosynthesis protein FlhA [Candidatus Omnitrophica bacterium]|nr:flagellar biosynthesis protein FlhA [Candidatus Omnitrophota bacterium]MBD3269150.1 flagellar biosynthesis protein FlhA [Candidatus Omnitrophota bacterium]